MSLQVGEKGSVPQAKKSERALQLRDGVAHAALVLEDQNLRAVEVRKQLGQLSVVEAAHEGIERGHRIERHITGTSHAVVVEPRTGRPVGVLSTLDIAGILGWGLG